MIRETTASKVSVHEAETLPLVDERLWETGGGRDGAHRIADAGGKHENENF